MKQMISWRGFISVLLLVTMVTASLPLDAFAQPAPAQGESDVCTNFAQRIQQMEQDAPCQGPNCSQGILSEIYIYIRDIVTDATQKLFKAFTGSAAYQRAVGGAMVLFVVIFGTAFTMGVVQVSFGQVLVRLVKIGIIYTLISPSGWTFFNDTMVNFFTNGTDELIKGVLQIGTGIQNIPADATPFYQFDKIAEFIIQPDTLIFIMGSAFSSGPFGFMMGGMMVVAFGGFIMLLIKALRIYAVAFVARTLLLGLAPIFFIFLLFERTKNLFMSWLNTLITLALQPILLFTFLSFFMVLIETATKDMFNTELCWDKFKSGEGTKEQQSFWRFKDPKTNSVLNSTMTWSGPLECRLSGQGNCAEFPINIVDILSFLVLIYLATRFAETIENIAKELGSAFISLDTGGRMDQFMRSQAESGKPLTNVPEAKAAPPKTTPR